MSSSTGQRPQRSACKLLTDCLLLPACAHCCLRRHCCTQTASHMPLAPVMSLPQNYVENIDEVACDSGPPHPSKVQAPPYTHVMPKSHKPSNTSLSSDRYVLHLALRCHMCCHSLRSEQRINSPLTTVISLCHGKNITPTILRQ